MKKLGKLKLGDALVLNESEMKCIVGGQYVTPKQCGLDSTSGVCSGVCYSAYDEPPKKCASEKVYNYDKTQYLIRCYCA